MKNLERFTEKQKEVIKEMKLGYTVSAIGRRLGKTKQGVQYLMNNVKFIMSDKELSEFLMQWETRKAMRKVKKEISKGGKKGGKKRR